MIGTTKEPIVLEQQRLHTPAHLYFFFCANKMAPNVSEGILRAEHDTKTLFGKKGG